jgi:hypothetical protein
MAHVDARTMGKDLARLVICLKAHLIKVWIRWPIASIKAFVG